MGGLGPGEGHDMGRLGTGEHNASRLGTGWAWAREWARANWARTGHDRIVSERHGYPLVISISCLQNYLVQFVLHYVLSHPSCHFSEVKDGVYGWLWRRVSFR
jgi:hypothetical protein